MAIAGGMTTAYTVTLRNGVLIVDKTTRPSAQCMTVDEAARTVRAGGTAIVAGSDTYALRQRLTTNEAGQ
jgi:hypothetical protein